MGTAISIIFDNLPFGEPVALASWEPFYGGGIYGILVPDVSCKPRPFREIYFGEASELTDRSYFWNHPAFASWLGAGGSDRNLHVSFCLFEGGLPSARRAVVNRLISAYKPICNRAKMFAGDDAQRAQGSLV